MPSDVDGTLQLEVADFKDADHWRWVLKDPAGKFLGDHEVSLDQSKPEYAGFLDLESYLRRYAAPDKWPEDDVRLIKGVGVWIGEHVLGDLGKRILDYGTPVVVRVVVPPEAHGLLHRPLELAYVGKKPLALQDVSLVFEVEGEARPARKEPIGKSLRMLAVFSLPVGLSALALRRERYELEQTMRRIAQIHSVSIDLRVLQYGVTRDSLKEALQEGEGWDIMHFSGHGLTSGLVLEESDGTQDMVPASKLAELLAPARKRLKLVTLSSCLSAAATVAETLRWLGIERTRDAEDGAGGEQEKDPTPLPTVARAVMSTLDCAVVAMRYPVGDEFAIKLGAQLYERMIRADCSLTRALQFGLPAALAGKLRPGVPPLSVATPALFGARAVDLRLSPPKSTEVSSPVRPTGFGYFPNEPERFVGRVRQMVAANAVLAPESKQRGVLFYGMAGSGKTACALELAYRHQRDRFQGFVWYKAPDEGQEVETALLDLATEMEAQLPAFQMVHLVDRPDEFTKWLPHFTEALSQNSILLVLDNLESLLTNDNTWRDGRWGQLIDALLAHNGYSRLVLTSRRLPQGLAGDKRLLRESIHSLFLNEAALLARELPNLSKLLRGDGVKLERGRELVSRTLKVVQGHPKLIEFAEQQAADPKALEKHLARAEEAWKGEEAQLQAFFDTGESQFEADAFLQALRDWTTAVSESLPGASRTAFHFLCCLEEGDRQTGVMKPVWPNLWKRLELPGEAPDPDAALGPVVEAGLADSRAVGEDSFAYEIHPGVAEAGREEAGGAVREAVDEELAAFWLAMFKHSTDEEMKGAGGFIVNAARSGVPYLLRREKWREASTLLEAAIRRDRSPSTALAVLPLLRHIANATRGTERELLAAGILARALAEAGRIDEAENMMRTTMGEAAERGDYRTATGVASDLINLLRDTGRCGEALKLVDETKQYTRRAGLGPWTQLADECQRLQLLCLMGRYEEVLAEAEALRQRMRSLPEEGPEEESVPSWNVRETIPNIAFVAAAELGSHQLALELNEEAVASKQARGAPALEIARSRYNDYGPLLRLRRYDEARAVLEECRTAFQRENDRMLLGKVFSALADLEDELQHRDQAIVFEETALRYTYLSAEPEDCAIRHFNVATYLESAERTPEAALAHRFAATIIHLQIGSGRWPKTRSALARHLIRLLPEPPIPKSFDDLCQIVEQVEGVHFKELFQRLAGPDADGDAVLQQVLAEAAEAMKELAEQAKRQQDE